MASLLCLVSVAALFLIPDGYERVAWKLQTTFAKLRRTVTGAPQALPTPETLAAMPTAVPLSSPTPELAATPLPTTTPAAAGRLSQVELTGFTHTWQKINNCGPATLAIDLSFWGWKGTQANTAAALKPDTNDRNVSPHELAEYARSVGLAAEIHVNGTQELLKSLLAAGFPVMIEKGIILPDVGWEGHYTLISGYSDATSNFTTQDSLQGPNFQFPYTLLSDTWRAFNYIYILIYPPGRQAEVTALLGPAADPAVNWQNAADRALEETQLLQGQELAFAWFNRGASLTNLGQAEAGVQAFDQARLAQLPWRMLWYQEILFQAYYTTGRYQDILVLAEATLQEANNIEEVYYWRGRAKLALGDQPGAVEDWRQAARLNRNYTEPRQALAELGVTP